MAADAPKTTAHDFAFTAIDGAPLPLKSFAGKAVLIVNTASQCGFTPQYAALQDLWTRYRDKGFVLLGVPSNDFGGQEPGTAAEIKEFCGRASVLCLGGQGAGSFGQAALEFP